MIPVTRHALGMTLMLGTALLAAACSSPSTTGTSAASTPSSTPAASSAPAATPGSSQPSATVGVAGCASSGLQVKVDTSQGGAAAGSTYVPIDFTNTTSSSCTLFGFPGVSF